MSLRNWQQCRCDLCGHESVAGLGDIHGVPPGYSRLVYCDRALDACADCTAFLRDTIEGHQHLCGRQPNGDPLGPPPTPARRIH